MNPMNNLSFPKPTKRIKVKKPLKRSTKPVKRAKSPLKKAKKKAETIFSLYIRTRDALKTTGGKESLLCITCDRLYPAFGLGCAQAGHFIPGRHPSVLFDERNAHGQCYNCNINLKGNWVKYEAKMILLYGIETVKELKELDKIDPHYKDFHYLEIYEKYKEKLDEM